MTSGEGGMVGTGLAEVERAAPATATKAWSASTRTRLLASTAA